MRRVLVVVLLGALLLAGAFALKSGASAGTPPTVGATDATLEPGEDGTSQVFTHGFIAPPGLGAWTVDIGYDPDVITVTGCNAVADTSVCNPDYAPGVVRSAGANAMGLQNDPVLAEIEFTCNDDEGETALEIMPVDVADATVGAPMLLDVVTSDGVVTCEVDEEPEPTSTSTGPGTETPTGGVQGTATPAPQPPSAGTGSGTPQSPWQVFAMMALLISAGVIFVSGVRVFAKRLE